MRGARLPLLGIAVIGALLLGPGVALAADDPSTGTPLTVNITDGSTASPTPGASTSPGPGPSVAPGGASPGTGSSGTGTGSSGGAGSAPAGGGGAPAGSTPATDEVNVGGMLYVGGVNASATPSWDPAEGTVDVWFTVRNASTSTIDATATFWVDGAIFSNRLDTVDAVAVAALQPGETRVVSAELHRGGQWTLLTAHATLTPPDSVGGTALTPVSRDTLVVLFPWLIVLIVVVLTVALVVARILRAVLVPVPAPVAAT